MKVKINNNEVQFFNLYLSTFRVLLKIPFLKPNIVNRVSCVLSDGFTLQIEI